MGSDVRLHSCYVCGATRPWDDAWSYYGSIGDLEDFGFVLKTCGEACKQKIEDTVNVAYETELEALGKRPGQHRRKY